MKKIFLFAFIIYNLTVSAQLTQLNHAPAIGDPFVSTYQCDSANIDPGPAGSSVNWDYSNLIEHLILSTYTTSPSNNPAYNQADISVSSATNNTRYYKSTTNELNYYGGDLFSAGINFNLNYSNPAIMAVYPMSLNSSTTSLTSGTVNTTSFGTGTFNGSCNVIADATGTLTLPSKIFTNVIRVVTSQTISTTLFGAIIYQFVYDYYSPGYSKAPILSINISTLTSILGTSNETIVTVQKDYMTVGEFNQSQNSNIELSVFPNPSANFVNFSTASIEATKVLAIDMTGKIIASEMLEMGKAKMNTSNLASGVYLYQVTDKNNQILTSGKFNIYK